VYSCSKKKNQGRFRHVGSDHSLSDALASVEGDSLETDSRSENSDMAATVRQQVLREPSVGIILIPG
jgi:hypothetical protein